MFEFQNYGSTFVKCSRGLEEDLAQEMTALGAEKAEPEHLGVRCRTDERTIYRAVLESRLASHVLLPLITFDCHSDAYLYKTARALDWSKLLSPETTFMIRSHVSGSAITHERFAAQRLKDAIVDWFMETHGMRPSVDKKQPDMQFDLNIRRNRAVISFDASRGTMHRRGYRTESTQAPLQETLAAAVIRWSGWTGEQPLVDPMCGSGTFLAEGLLAAGHVPSGWKRCRIQAPPLHMPGFTQELWDEVRAEAEAKRVPVAEDLVRGSDLSSDALRATRANLRLVPGGSKVPLQRIDFRKLDGAEDSMIITNPPFGVRLEELDTAMVLYRDLGDWLKQKCTGSTAWVVCGHRDLVGALGLKPKRKIPIWNGGIECRLVELELY